MKSINSPEIIYEELFDGIQVGIFRSTPDGEIIAVNQALVEILGYQSKAEVYSINAKDLYVDPTKRADWITSLEDSQNGSFEYQLLRGDGTQIWVEEQARVVKDKDGETLYYEGNIQDISSHKEKDIALQASEAKYRSLFEESGEAIFIIDTEGNIQEYNHAFLDLFNYLPQAIPKLKAQDLYANKSEWDEISSQIAESVLGAIKSQEYIFVKQDQSQFDGLITAKLILDNDNNPLGIQNVLIDISKRKKRQLELETIVSINSALRSSETVKDMLPIILEQSQIITKALSSSIFICDEQQTLTVEESIGEWDSWKTKLSPSLIEIAKEVVDSLQPFFSPDVTVDDNIEYPEEFLGLKSVVCLPLSTQDLPVGVLWIGKDKPFSEETIRLVTILTNIAGNAIDRLILFENNARALTETTALADIARELNSNLDLENMFNRIVSATEEIMQDVDRSIIHLYDHISKRLIPAVTSSNPYPDKHEFTFPKIKVTTSGEFNFDFLDQGDIEASSMSKGKGVAGLAIESGETINIINTDNDPRFIKKGSSDIKSIVVSPIILHDKVLGTLSIMSEKNNAFDAEDESLLERLCTHASITVNNAQLFEAERVQRQMAEAQAKITALLNTTLDLDTILNLFLEQTIEIFNVSAANIMLTELDNTTATKNIGYRAGDDLAGILEKDLVNLQMDDTILRMMNSKKPLLVSNTSLDPSWNSEYSFDWVKSYAGIPLLVNQEIIGFLNVDSHKPGFITEDLVKRLKAFADEAAIAVKNAQLYKELGKSLETEQSTRSRLLLADKHAGMGRMVASVAHELNNPLQTIKNCLFLIEKSFGDEESELYEMALSEVERLSGIVGRLREVYRPHNPDMDFIEISPLLADLEMLLETHLRRNNVVLNVDVNKKMKNSILGIPDQLKQVFLNLSLNSIEAMQPVGGTLTIKIAINKSTQQIGIVFSDTGPGIPDQDIKFIFDPFYTTKHTGMGLGLSICFDIAQNHDGEIIVENNPDVGASFTVWLPIQKNT